jgi:hypothetical protein
MSEEKEEKPLAEKEVTLETFPELDEKLQVLLDTSMSLIQQDRAQAEETFKELRDIVLGGSSDPDTLRELNKAQENVASTTESTIRVLAQLTRLKSGDMKVQMAKINEARKVLDAGGEITTAKILKALEESEKAAEEEASDQLPD